MVPRLLATATPLAVLSWLATSRVQAAATAATSAPKCSWVAHELSTTRDTCRLPIDSRATAPEHWMPWSYPPHCFEPARKEGDTTAYCLFTDTAFRGSGISVVTTPELAASLTGGILDDGAVPASQRDHPSSPMSPGRHGGDELAYEIRDLPGRGKGVVATRRIGAWEVIMVQFPAMVMQMDLWEAVTSPKQSRRLLNKAVRQLPPDTQERIKGLARSGRVQDPLEDVLRTNVFGLDLNGVLHMGLFVGASRINHNCRPNIFWRHNAKTMAMEVVAVRDIDVGEEITYSYVTLGKPQKMRQEELSEWGFECACALCRAAPDERQRSDDRRARLAEIGESLTQAEALVTGAGDDSSRLSQLVAEVTALIDAEQLWPQLVVYHPLVARAFLRAGDVTQARRHTALAEEAWLRFQGADHDYVEGLRELWREVREAACARGEEAVGC
ncbi:hypothetical protein GGTG_02553 [Gaeumannomyces tritici R3-111a-1]|uniref:SET domain-containing protein n=1 Tax=Gaeumannomyces tritici (strain R3-111a-1) TaxID=644352 RepID=J3NMP7_GAET3|nr:hypothetical protein GGTG_02553 [Gaeumannomyces tritici R3-111a-1]EJT82580.1 hypothetical protein GGTG_02553 [Gaeumannomyces tritici R3-111a-1]